jgi:drug/metabolite transporter (DMT)-like permease
MSPIIPFLAVVALAGVGVLGDYFVKQAGAGPAYIYYTYFFAGMFTYALTTLGWFFTMKHVKLSTLGMVYSLSTAILLALVGVVFFKEHLSTTDMIGIALGVISLFILGRAA